MNRLAGGNVIAEDEPKLIGLIEGECGDGNENAQRPRPHPGLRRAC